MLNGAQLIGFHESAKSVYGFTALDPNSGQALSKPAFQEATESEINEAVDLAAAAAPDLRRRRGDALGGLCAMIADSLESDTQAIVARAGLETGYAPDRLEWEFRRTVEQLGLFGRIAREGAWRAPRIDLGVPDRLPSPGPDVRSLLFPLGPVAIFGAGNFPFALSCAGGDTASALAAGCPVVFRGHPNHPGTCELAARAIIAAVKASGFPEGTFSLLQGRKHHVGTVLVQHPKICAVGFTGSLRGGRALFDLVNQREKPVPFFGEMGSFNPQFVYPDLLQEAAERFAERLYESVTLGHGQFCTNPGLVIVPTGPATDRFLETYENRVRTAASAPLLSLEIQETYFDGLQTLDDLLGVEVTGLDRPAPPGCHAYPALAVTSQEVFQRHRDLFEEELFGPVTIVVICNGPTSYARIAQALPGQLAASIHGNAGDLRDASELMEALSGVAGRVCVNQFPTGIEICDAMHHGGLYPAATLPHFTSIGPRAIERWGRRVTFQNGTAELLPDALKSDR